MCEPHGQKGSQLVNADFIHPYVTKERSTNMKLAVFCKLTDFNVKLACYLTPYQRETLAFLLKDFVLNALVKMSYMEFSICVIYAGDGFLVNSA